MKGVIQNNKIKVLKIHSRLGIYKMIIFILAAIMIYRIISIAPETNKISSSYNFYTVILPSVLIIYSGLDLLFYSMYVRSNSLYMGSKIINKNSLFILIIWIMVVFLVILVNYSYYSVPVLELPKVIFYIQIIPIIISLLLPIYLLYRDMRGIRLKGPPW